MVRTTFEKLVRTNSLYEEQVRLLQDQKYCKNTFDINFPFFKKVMPGTLPSQQIKINGYNRFWEKTILIKGEKFFICNDWYERNRSRFIAWSNHIVH